jgi:hypothetical protein
MTWRRDLGWTFLQDARDTEGDLREILTWAMAMAEFLQEVFACGVMW